MTNPKDDNAVFHAVIALLIVLPLAAWKGWVLVRLWTWFVVPLGVPRVEVWQAAGLALLIGWVADSSGAATSDDRRTSGERLAATIGVGILAPLIAWGGGAIYHALML